VSVTQMAFFVTLLSSGLIPPGCLKLVDLNHKRCVKDTIVRG
jgi:hypothetical protein